MDRLLGSVNYYYHQLDKVRFGLHRGKIKWYVTLEYRLRNATFFVYTDPKLKVLHLNDILEDLFTKTIIDDCGYVEFCELFEYKRNRKSEELYNEWIEIINNLKYVFAEDYDILKASV